MYNDDSTVDSNLAKSTKICCNCHYSTGYIYIFYHENTLQTLGNDTLANFNPGISFLTYTIEELQDLLFTRC